MSVRLSWKAFPTVSFDVFIFCCLGYHKSNFLRRSLIRFLPAKQISIATHDEICTVLLDYKRNLM